MPRCASANALVSTPVLSTYPICTRAVSLPHHLGGHPRTHETVKHPVRPNGASPRQPAPAHEQVALHGRDA
jgi:hypothetical protein